MAELNTSISNYLEICNNIQKLIQENIIYFDKDDANILKEFLSAINIILCRIVEHNIYFKDSVAISLDQYLSVMKDSDQYKKIDIIQELLEDRFRELIGIEKNSRK